MTDDRRRRMTEDRRRRMTEDRRRSSVVRRPSVIGRCQKKGCFMSENILVELQRTGQSIWYDNVRRALIQNGDLASKIKDDDLRGVTSNPAIFEKAIVGSTDYDQAMRELIAAGKASVMIPFPLAADDHQRKNAEALARAGAGRMILQQDLSGERLAQEIKALAGEPERISTMEHAARKLARGDAAAAVVDMIEELVSSKQ